MIESNDLKQSDVIMYDGVPHMVLFVQHHKMAAADAVYRVKLKNLKNGAIFERTFKAEEKFEEVNIEKRKQQFLYKEGARYHFIDLESYEEVVLDESIISDKKFYLIENLEVDGIY
ncbi:MAG: elongation factor P, partial [bacterium]|nr:elongation factor P [bacterium]